MNYIDFTLICDFRNWTKIHYWLTGNTGNVDLYKFCRLILHVDDKEILKTFLNSNHLGDVNFNYMHIINIDIMEFCKDRTYYINMMRTNIGKYIMEIYLEIDNINPKTYLPKITQLPNEKIIVFLDCARHKVLDVDHVSLNKIDDVRFLLKCKEIGVSRVDLYLKLGIYTDVYNYITKDYLEYITNLNALTIFDTYKSYKNIKEQTVKYASFIDALYNSAVDCDSKTAEVSLEKLSEITNTPEFKYLLS